MADTFIVGLDLGQQHDPSALAVLQLSAQEERGRRRWRHECRALHRWPLGTPYTRVVADVAEWFGYPPLTYRPLALDLTGVGRPVFDLFRAAKIRARLVPVTITAGLKATPAPAEEGGGWHVPKKELVSTLQVLLQSGRLRVAEGLDLAKALALELTNFRVKVTAAAAETFGAWREGESDDLVLAVALAAWLGERSPPRTPGDLEQPAGGRTVADSLGPGVWLT